MFRKAGLFLAAESIIRASSHFQSTDSTTYRNCGQHYTDGDSFIPPGLGLGEDIAAGTRCSYFFRSNLPYALIKIKTFHLNYGSTVSLYDNWYATTPFLKLYNRDGGNSHLPFISNTNTIIMVFDNPKGGKNVYGTFLFAGYFSGTRDPRDGTKSITPPLPASQIPAVPAATSCGSHFRDGNFFRAPGIGSGEDLQPGFYCEYLFQSSFPYAQVVFENFSLNKGSSIRLYDERHAHFPFAMLCNQDGLLSASFVSYSNRIYMVFNNRLGGQNINGSLLYNGYFTGTFDAPSVPTESKPYCAWP